MRALSKIVAAPRFDKYAMLRTIASLVQLGPRRPGSEAGSLSEALLANELARMGYDVRLEPIEIEAWNLAASSLTVDGSELEAFPIPYTPFTRVEGVLVSADDRSTDWRGKIVVAEIGFPPLTGKAVLGLSLGSYDPDESIHEAAHPATWVRLGWHLYRRAAARGAAGFIGILTDQPGGSCKMYAPYGFREDDIWDKPIPGFWVSRDDRTRLQAGSSATLEVRGARVPAVTHNIVAVREGDGSRDEDVILGSHHDTPFDSPVEDASGVAVVMELAKHFAETAPLSRRLVILLSAGHFYGSIGTRRFIEKHAQTHVRRAVLQISIEHIAREAREDVHGQLVPTGRPEPSALFTSLNRTLVDATLAAVAKAGLDRCFVLPAESPLGPYPPTDGGDWHLVGVPLVNFISNPVYLLTAEDDWKWVDEERLVPAAEAFAALIRELDQVEGTQLRRKDYPLRRRVMRLSRWAAAMKTTRMGTRPVH